jgi:hypothetical protein
VVENLEHCPGERTVITHSEDVAESLVVLPCTEQIDK